MGTGSVLSAFLTIIFLILHFPFLWFLFSYFLILLYLTQISFHSACFFFNNLLDCDFIYMFFFHDFLILFQRNKILYLIDNSWLIILKNPLVIVVNYFEKYAFTLNFQDNLPSLLFFHIFRIPCYFLSTYLCWNDMRSL